MKSKMDLNEISLLFSFQMSLPPEVPTVPAGPTTSEAPDAQTAAVTDLLLEACAPYEALISKSGEREWIGRFYSITPYNPYPALTVEMTFTMGSSGGCSPDNILVLPVGLTYPVPLANVILPKLIAREFEKYSYVDAMDKARSTQAL